MTKAKVICFLLTAMQLLLIPYVVYSATANYYAVTDSEEYNSKFWDVQCTGGSGKCYHDIYYLNQNQYAAFRFEGINLPVGIEITSVSLHFNVWKAKNLDTDAKVYVYGENAAIPAPFSKDDNDISSRKPTTKLVTWDPEESSQTPDLTEIVREIIALDGWDSSKTIVLLTKSNKESNSQIMSVSAAEETHNVTNRPKLVIEYNEGPTAHIETSVESLGPTCFAGYNAASTSFILEETKGTVDFIGTVTTSGESWLSVSNGTFDADNPLVKGTSKTITVNFSTANLDPGSYSASIYITGNADNSRQTITVPLLVKDVPVSAACGEIPLYAENLINPAIMVQLDTSGSMGYQMPILSSGKNPRTPSLVDIVQEIVDRQRIDDETDPDYPQNGWASGNEMAFVISGTGDRRAFSYDGQSVGAPKLTITYSTDAGSSVDVEYRVSSSGGDVQRLSSSVKTDEDYLQLGKNDSPVGLFFDNVAIPNGAKIESAEIQFVISSGGDQTTKLVIKGVDKDTAPPFTDILQLTEDLTGTQVEWDVESWKNTMSRIDIAEDVLKEIFLDRSIQWGFATWSGGRYCNMYDTPPAGKYTNYWVGVHQHDTSHQSYLQDAVKDLPDDGCTPLAPTMDAALAYFTGSRDDLTYKKSYTEYDCQPRIVVLVTDGMGNTATNMDLVETRAKALIAEGISVVAVGFGIDEKDAGQLYKIAELAQAAGKVDDSDQLYALHDENSSGTGVPFLAQSREDFINAMSSIVSSVKNEAFHGSSPAATTSADDGEILLSSTFDPTNWTGDVTATKFNAYTGALQNTPLWVASEKMPSTINGFIYDSTATFSVSSYTNTSLATDSYLCKPLGDIINSTPKLVGKPAYWYNFDSYSKFKYNSSVYGRDALAYVAANDGALHAFNLSTGVEKWRFYPDAVKAKMNEMAVDPIKNMCSTSYCHEFVLDGSPQAADIYNGTDWKTIVVTGLGRGGAAYFALDVTYANDFTHTTSIDKGDTPSKFLWEFTDEELGFATSFPEIERVGRVDETGKSVGSTWLALFGSGASSENVLSQNDKEAYLFGINAYDKSSVWLDSSDSSVKINKVKLSPVTLKDDVAGPPVAIDLDDDYLNERVYLGNYYGNMYRVTNIGEGEVPEVTIFFNSTQSGHSAPSLSKPGYAISSDDDANGIHDIWLYFGTGEYEEQIDKVTTDQQYFYGLKDVEGSSVNTADPQDAVYVPSDLATLTTSIVEAYALNSKGEKVDINADKVVDSNDILTYRTISCSDADKDKDGNCNADKKSWMLKLLAGGDPSERSLNQPLVVGGIVFFTTFIPDGEPCEGSGDAYLMAVDWEMGSAVNDAVFDVNNDGVFDSSDAYVLGTDGTLMRVAGIYLGTGKPTDPVIHGDVLFVGTTGTSPKPIKVNIPDQRARLKAWRQLFND